MGTGSPLGGAKAQGTNRGGVRVPLGGRGSFQPGRWWPLNDCFRTQGGPPSIRGGDPSQPEPEPVSSPDLMGGGLCADYEIGILTAPCQPLWALRRAPFPGPCVKGRGPAKSLRTTCASHSVGCGQDPEKSGWSPNSTRPSHWNVETHGKAPCKSHDLTPIFSMNPQPRREGTQASWKPQGEPQGVGFPTKQPPAGTRAPVLGASLGSPSGSM